MSPHPENVRLAVVEQKVEHIEKKVDGMESKVNEMHAVLMRVQGVKGAIFFILACVAGGSSLITYIVSHWK